MSILRRKFSRAVGGNQRLGDGAARGGTAGVIVCYYNHVFCPRESVNGTHGCSSIGDGSLVDRVVLYTARGPARPEISQNGPGNRYLPAAACPGEGRSRKSLTTAPAVMCRVQLFTRCSFVLLHNNPCKYVLRTRARSSFHPSSAGPTAGIARHAFRVQKRNKHTAF